MKFCTSCGRPRSGPGKFCAGCGAPFPDDVGSEAPTARTTPSAPAPPAAITELDDTMISRRPPDGTDGPERVVTAGRQAPSGGPATEEDPFGDLFAPPRTGRPPRGSSLPASPLGQGCGHELRPGAQFCTVCGSQAADDGRRTALVAEEQVPAPGPEVTAIRPVPTRPEPVTLTSPATITDRPSERSSDGGVGPGPQWGWPDPSPAPDGAMPPPGGAMPRQGRQHRSRWLLVVGVVALLAAGGAAAVFIVQPFQHSHAATGTPRTSPPAPRQQSSASANPTPSSTPTPSSQSAQQRAAASLAALLAQSVTDRSSIVNAVNSISQCGPALSQDPQILESAAASHQRLLSQLASLPGRSALSGQMFQALTGAWLASATADRDFAQWAQDELSRGCTQNDQADPNFQAAAAPDAQATADKKAFVNLWNPIAAQYGLTSYAWNQL